MVYDKHKKYYNIEEAQKFWKYIQPIEKDEFVEIRLTGIHDVEDKNASQIYREISTFAFENNLKVRKNCIFFIKTFEELKKIIMYRNGWFCYYTKVCYAINNRFVTKENNGMLTGGYDSVPFFTKVFLDVESVKHDTLKDGTFFKELLFDYVKMLKQKMKEEGFEKSVVISSGSGYHLIFPIQRIETSEENKKKYRKYIIRLHNFTKNEMYAIDKLYDATRVMGLPGTLNRKRNSMVRIIEEENGEIPNVNFILPPNKIVKKKVKHKSMSGLPEITKSLEYNVLLAEPPQGERNNTLIFALKLLLKAHGIKDTKEFETQLQLIYGGSIDLTPTKGTENKTYSSGIIINYCRRNMTWMRKNPKILKLYEKYVSGKLRVVYDNSLKEGENVFE